MGNTISGKQITELDDIITWGTVIGPPIVLLTFSPLNLDYFGLPKLTALYLVTLFLIYFQTRRWIISGRAEIPFEYIHLLSVVIILITIATTLTSANPLESVLGVSSRYESLIALLCYTAILWFSFKSAQEKDFKHRFEMVFILSFLVINIFGLLEISGLGILNSPFLENGRLSSTLGNPVFFGAFLSMALPILLAKALFLSHGSKRIWDSPIVIFILICLGIAMLFSTLSRGAWLGTVAGFLVVLYLKVRGKKGVSPLPILWAIIILVGLVMGIILALGLTSTDIPHIFGMAKSAGSFDTRVELWKSSVSLISKKPLSGYGLDQTKDWISHYLTIRLARVENAVFDRAHNIYMQTAINGGILLLLAQVWIFVYVLLRGIKSTEKNHDYIAAGFTGAVVGYLVQGMTGIATNDLSAFLWFIMGTIIGITSKENVRVVRLPVIGSSTLKRAITPIVILLTLLVLFPMIAEARFGASLEEASATMSESALEQACEAGSYCTQPVYQKRLALLCLSFARSKEDKRFVKLAINTLNRGLKYSPDSIELLETLGFSYLAAADYGKDKESLALAGKYLKRAHEKAPMFLDIYPGLLEFYIRDGDYHGAIMCAKEMNKINDKDSRSRVAAAISYKLKGDSKKADVLFREIDKSDPEVKALKDRLLENISYHLDK